jgi:hypothetical protein
VGGQDEGHRVPPHSVARLGCSKAPTGVAYWFVRHDVSFVVVMP